jgi:hypothetical protein
MSPEPRSRRPGALLVVLSAGLGATLLAAASAGFLDLAINADTLYPALLAEALRADAAALWRFRPSRIPSWLPDIGLHAGIDLATGSWRLAFWGYGFGAFLLLAALGGHLGGLALGRGRAAGAAAVALLAAGLLALGLLPYGAPRPFSIFDRDWPADLALTLLLPVFQSGAFLAGLAVIALAWRAMRRPGGPVLAALFLLVAGAVASNAIVIAHAVLPVAIALGLALWRAEVAARRVAAVLAPMAAGSLAGLAFARWRGMEEMPILSPAAFLSNSLDALASLPGQPMLLLALAASLPVGLAFLMPVAAARRLGVTEPVAFRFVLTVACAAMAAGVVLALPQYYVPASWRYANPLAWWPVILLGGVLAGPLGALLRRPAAVAVLCLLLVGGGLARGAPKLPAWQPELAACLDRLDPEGAWRAGFADYWNARRLAAAMDWRRQVEQLHGDGTAALYINDPATFLQRRHGPPGEAPEYRFIVMQRLAPLRIRAIFGAADRVESCGGIEVWIYDGARNLAAALR